MSVYACVSSVYLSVNQDIVNHNRYIRRLVIMHAEIS